ncbi:SH3 domain-containing protein [Thauera sp. CAU 1555]|uniref:SH3 domain-containing protein n=1 Tax=Thauera sedimentorum TaxID=2767595 RepID=A0ABR9BEG9_9RHOO|nr:SH3 domain-containing protein [Thauera sedimentorum]MBC9073708.1 SH3 domain-containing protein [Thauera sedimentorum]MBD8504627.1 SH3 domain-containing protein [Thauera sedimentorum]
MSLINDMLRDIDRRSIGHELKPTALDDTVTVPPLRARRWPPSWVLLLSVTAVLATLAAFLLYGQAGQPARPVPEPAQMAQPAARAPATPAPPAAAAERAATGQAAQDTPAVEPPAPPARVENLAAAASTLPPASAQPAAEPAAPQEAPPPAAEAPAPAPQSVEVLPGKRVNLRSGPGTEHPVLHVLSARSTLQLLGESRGYLQVRTVDGTTGWISAEFTTAGAPAGSSPAAEATPAAATVATAIAPAEPPAEPQAAPAPAARPQISAPAAESAGDHLSQALRALDRGQTDLAERGLRRALELDPGHAQSVNVLAALLLRQERRAELEALLRKLVAGAAGEPAPAVLLARLHAQGGDTAGALQLIEALPAERLSAEQLAVLATLQQRAGRHADAVANYRRALAGGQQRGTTWAGLAVSLEALAQPAEARAAWEAALAAGPLDAPLAQHARKRLAALGGHGE